MMKGRNWKIYVGILSLFVFVIVCVVYNQFKESYGATTKYLTLKSNTVCTAHKDATCLSNLRGIVYVTNPNSNKWVILIHGYKDEASNYVKRRAAKYIEQGYNYIAPDLRDHGSTGGTLSLGYLESLDVYDWIKDLNKNWKDSSRYGVNVAPETIIVHGTSMGAATTLQLATNPDIANANGSEPYTKNLTDLHVKGFVDDCGYTSTIELLNDLYGLENFSSSSETISNVYRGLYAETINYAADFGIEKGTFDKYEDPFANGRKFPSGSKILIIHDKQDKTVPYSNADIVSSNISPGILVYKWTTNGLGHAFYNNDYAALVEKYIKCVENSSCTKI